MKPPNGYFKPAALPNVAGFKFIGITADMQEKPCEVVKDEKMLSHYTIGIEYCNLIGWRNIRK